MQVIEVERGLNVTIKLTEDECRTLVSVLGELAGKIGERTFGIYEKPYSVVIYERLYNVVNSEE